MKKILIIALCAAMVGGLQSCQKSPDANARDYCATVKTLLEDRDLEKIQEVNEKAQKYLEDLSPEDQQAFMQGIQKYQQEFKLDSIYGRMMQEQAGANPYAGGAPAQGQDAQAAPQKVDTIVAGEEEEVEETEAVPAAPASKK